jgi:hypothetical protein
MSAFRTTTRRGPGGRSSGDRPRCPTQSACYGARFIYHARAQRSGIRPRSTEFAARFREDVRQPYVDANGVRLHAVTGGSGRPLLLVHGWAADLVPMAAGDAGTGPTSKSSRSISEGLACPTNPRAGTTRARKRMTWSRSWRRSAIDGSRWLGSTLACRSLTRWPRITPSGRNV